MLADARLSSATDLDERDSPVEFLWQTNFGDATYADQLIAMFRAYFDGSGKIDQHEVIVFAGWVSTSQKWSEFARAWTAVLRKPRYNVPYFHMKEFAHSVGAFANGWKGDEDKRRDFLGELIAVIYSTVQFGVAQTVSRAGYAEIDREYELSEHYGSEYALSAFLCMTEAYNWVAKREKRRVMRVSYVFDRGDQGKGDLIRLAEQANWPIPAFHASRDDAKTGECGVVQLQAADFAAYELFRVSLLPRDTTPPEAYRKTAHLLSAMPNRFMDHDAKGLRNLCREVGISRRAT